jgi:predicted ABC-type transport system involved in lysophospholipase L1 biosynthesis ATPase subunit
VTHDERLAARCDARFELGTAGASARRPASLDAGGGP